MDTIILDMGPHVKGESTRGNYRDKIELLSFSHGVAMQITGDVSSSKRTSGRPSHQDMTVAKRLDSTSPILNQSCCEGRMFPKVEIIVGRNDHDSVTELLRYTLKNVMISSISVGGGGGDIPVETLTLNYNEITWHFYMPKQEGGSEGSWNLKANAPS